MAKSPWFMMALLFSYEQRSSRLIVIPVFITELLGGCVVTEQKTGISNPLFTKYSFVT